MTGSVIPFYGAAHRATFAIERRAMDRDGLVIDRLDQLLPPGWVLDVGAGDGFTAERLTAHDRTVIAVEPELGMMATHRLLPWVRGVAQSLPFATATLDAAYATWAYFFPSIGHGDEGLDELHRAVRRDGPLLVVDNAGEDEFTNLSKTDISSDAAWWRNRGFETEVVRTSFRFDTITEARQLLGFYFGESGIAGAKIELEFRVALHRGRSRGG